MPQFNRLLITGAAGALGSVLRDGLAPLADTIRLTDRTEMDDARPHEEIMPASRPDALPFTSRPPEHLAGQRVGRLSAGDHGHAVDQHVVHSLR